MVANFHGLFDGPDKHDNPDRISQAHIIKDFLSRSTEAKILCGDFNLLPNSESLAMIKGGMRDLIKENNVQSTRSKLFPLANKFSDYIFVSPEVTVNQFKVLDDTISDHLPMLLEFE